MSIKHLDKMEQALNQMPNYFTSNMMTKQLRSMGVPDSAFCGRQLSQWLVKKASRITPQKWSKIIAVIPSKKDGLFAEQTTDVKITSAINLLKSHGYRIMKPKTEWEEIA